MIHMKHTHTYFLGPSPLRVCIKKGTNTLAPPPPPSTLNCWRSQTFKATGLNSHLAALLVLACTLLLNQQIDGLMQVDRQLCSLPSCSLPAELTHG